MPGGFPEVKRWRRLGTWHLLDQSLADGTLGHWTPNTNIGFASQWQGVGSLGPHAMATDGSQLFLGGDFTTVNNKPQQGIAIFPTGLGSGAAGQSDHRADGDQHLGRGGFGQLPRHFEHATSARSILDLPRRGHQADRYPDRHLLAGPGDQPVLRYQDTGLTPGSSHTYTYQANDGTHTTAKSPASAPVTVAQPARRWPISRPS